MGMTVEDHIHRIAAERLFQPARAEVGVDLQRLALHRGGYRRVVQQGHPPLGSQLSQRGLQLQRLVQRLPHELLDQSLTPGAKRPPPEPSGKPLDPGEPDAEHFVASPSRT